MKVSNEDGDCFLADKLIINFDRGKLTLSEKELWDILGDRIK